MKKHPRKNQSANYEGIAGCYLQRLYAIKQYFEIITYARLTIRVNTVLTNLSAALGRPTTEIHCDSTLWKTEGCWSDGVINLGDIAQPPIVDRVE